VDSHGEAEDTEDDVDAPLDVDEGGWDEVGKGEVEDPEVGSVFATMHALSDWVLTSWMRLRRRRPFHGCGEGRSQGGRPRRQDPR
jgi:hypothetical protein